MLEYTPKIQQIAAKLLAECKVDVVIGFKQGSVPLMNEPCQIRKAEDVAQLCWDSNCGINLANYLPGRKERIGIVAKGCDSRNIVNHIVENKIKRDQLIIIGVPCQGMIDRRAVAQRAGGEITAVAENQGKVVVTVGDKTITIEKAEVLQGNCRLCTHRNPVIHDELVAEPVAEQTDIDRWADVRAIEAMSGEQRRTFFEELLAPCIRCYACRNACPLCYCPTCFVDESRPQWVGKGQDPADITTFHILRAYHCAGRCTDCGACERACPVGINMRLLTRKLNKDCFELYGWETGLTLDQRPALDTFKPEDSNEFIK